MSINDTLIALDIDISKPPKAIGSYVAFKKVGKLVFISGQLPFKKDGTLIKGKVGLDIDLKDSQDASYYCCVNILAQINAACNGNLDLVKNCIKITGFVNSIDTFKDQPKVINPASELLVKVFGDNGKHARAAVSVNSLPLGVAVEIEAIFELN
ncbi:RidA family protein [Pelagibacteraceae bacterium]|jgi:enamine deaminase RidA (YjgF/YER057c/UK114 family)|nr:RidA family protein [Pelagibacteraceae bacterium]